MKAKLNHVGLVFDDMDEAMKLWRDTLGLPVAKEEDNAAEEVEIVFLQAGEGAVEIISPTTDDSGIAKYLAKKGAGAHHVCIEVEDIAATMKKLTSAGYELINEEPRTRHDGTLYAFTHPKSTFGVMIELYQEPEK